MPEFLPISRADMQRRGWEQCDFVYVVGVGAIGNMYAAALSLVINVFGSIYFNAKEKKAAA